jgi:hypothetical protein
MSPDNYMDDEYARGPLEMPEGVALGLMLGGAFLLGFSIAVVIGVITGRI